MGRPKKQTVSIHAGSGLYRCWYKGHQFYGHTEKEALDKRKEYIKKLEAGLKANARPQLISEYAYPWLRIAKAGVSAHTFDAYSGILDKLVDVIGDRYLDEVCPSDIKKVYSEKFAGLSDSHIKHARNLYCLMFDYAVADGLISKNPAKDPVAKPHRGTSGSHRSITEDERKMIETLDHPLRPVLMLMLYAGLRNSEALAINIDKDIDFKNNIVRVQSFWHVNGNDAFVSSYGKTQNASREVPLVDVLKDCLTGLHGPVASRRDGSVLTVSAWRRAWENYVNAAEAKLNGCQRRLYEKRAQDRDVDLPPWKEFTVRPYDLRHSFCTWCRDRGVDMHVLQKWMGHSDISMIARVYDHVSEDRIKNEAKKLKKKA